MVEKHGCQFISAPDLENGHGKYFPSKNVGYVSLQRNYESPIYFLKTVDGGATWDEMLFMNDYYFIQGIGFIDENLGWMGGNSSYPTFVTTDGGQLGSADFGSRVNRLDFINNTSVLLVEKQFINIQ